MKPKKIKVVKIKDVLSKKEFIYKKELTKKLANTPLNKLKKTFIKPGGFVKIRPKRTKFKSSSVISFLWFIKFKTYKF